MKRIILVALLATVAACSKPAPAPEATAEASAEAAAPAAATGTLAADGKPSHGIFKVTRKAGVFTADVKPDGTFSVTGPDGKVVETGKWEQKSPESYCETPDKEGAKQKCYEEKVDEKGIYTSKNPETGEVATVVRVEG